jgi:hypothetical protein
LAHLHVKDVTFAMEAAAPLDQFQAYMARMGRPDIPVYSSASGRFRDELHPSPHGTGSFGLSVFLRDGERVYRTYSTQGRGVDGVPLIDLTPYGRQESFEDSPEGWPQRETYSFGKIHERIFGRRTRRSLCTLDHRRGLSANTSLSTASWDARQHEGPALARPSSRSTTALRVERPAAAALDGHRSRPHSRIANRCRHRSDRPVSS